MRISQLLNEGEVGKLVIAFPERNKTGVENQLNQEAKPKHAGQNETTACPGHGRNHTVSAAVWPISCIEIIRMKRALLILATVTAAAYGQVDTKEIDRKR